MYLKLNKKKIKSLSQDKSKLPVEVTAHIAGGLVGVSAANSCNPQYCNVGSYAVACKDA